MVFIYPAVISQNVDDKYLPAICKTMELFFLYQIIEAFNAGILHFYINVNNDGSMSPLQLECDQSKLPDYPELETAMMFLQEAKPIPPPPQPPPGSPNFPPPPAPPPAPTSPPKSSSGYGSGTLNKEEEIAEKIRQRNEERRIEYENNLQSIVDNAENLIRDAQNQINRLEKEIKADEQQLKDVRSDIKRNKDDLQRKIDKLVDARTKLDEIERDHAYQSQSHPRQRYAQLQRLIRTYETNIRTLEGILRSKMSEESAIDRNIQSNQQLISRLNGDIRNIRSNQERSTQQLKSAYEKEKSDFEKEDYRRAKDRKEEEELQKAKEKEKEKSSRKGPANVSITTTGDLDLRPSAYTIEPQIVYRSKSKSLGEVDRDERRSMIVSVKVLPIYVKNFDKFYDVLQSDFYANQISYIYRTAYRGILRTSLKWMNYWITTTGMLSWLNKIYRFLFPKTDFRIWADMILRKKGLVDAASFVKAPPDQPAFHRYAAAIVVLSSDDIRQYEENFFLNAKSMQRLFNMGWNSFCIMDDAQKMLTFCPVNHGGYCSRIRYDYLYKSLGAPDVFKDIDPLAKLVRPIASIQKSVNLKKIAKECTVYKNIQTRFDRYYSELENDGH